MSDAFDAFRLEVGLSTLDELIDRPEWHARAACRGKPLDWFFPTLGATGTRAKNVCARCPVVDECGSFALNNPSEIGVWGGTDFYERRRLRATQRKAA